MNYIGNMLPYTHNRIRPQNFEYSLTGPVLRRELGGLASDHESTIRMELSFKELLRNV